METEHPIVDGQKLSKILVHNDAMRVVQFAFAAGQELAEHEAPGAVAVVLNSGRLDFTVDGTVNEMVGGDVLYLSPGVPHSVVAREPSRMTLVIVPQEG
nr:cupin domain-containing protein [Kocuria sp. JC486]